MSTIHIPGDLLAVEVPEGSYGFNVYDLMKKGQAFFFETVTRLFDVDLPEGNWQIVGLASELLANEGKGFVKALMQEHAKLYKSRFKSANLDLTKEYAILRKV